MVTSNVQKLMERQRISIRKMVERTGLTNMTILRARRKDIIQCRLSTLQTIADCLGCKIKDLFDEISQPD